MKDVSVSCQKPSENRRNLQWDDLSLTGRAITCVLFFLLYLGPSHLMSTTTDYSWYVRLLLNLPWLIIGLSLIVPCLNRIPVDPHICGFIAVFISSIIVAVVTPKASFPEWATAFTIAGLATLMTGPMLRGYDKNSGQGASAEPSGERETPMTQDLKS